MDENTIDERIMNLEMNLALLERRVDDACQKMVCKPVANQKHECTWKESRHKPGRFRCWACGAVKEVKPPTAEQFASFSGAAIPGMGGKPSVILCHPENLEDARKILETTEPNIDTDSDERTIIQRPKE